MERIELLEKQVVGFISVVFVQISGQRLWSQKVRSSGPGVPNVKFLVAHHTCSLGCPISDLMRSYEIGVLLTCVPPPRFCEIQDGGAQKERGCLGAVTPKPIISVHKSHCEFGASCSVG